MSTDLLDAAKKHEGNREYAKAISCLEQFMKENQPPYEDMVYASYGKCLRSTGKISCAKEVLLQGKALYPDSEQILKESCTLYEVSGDWDAAKPCAQALIHVNPNQADHHIRLGGIYSQLKAYNEAKEAYQNALEFRHGLSLEALMKKIRQGFAENPADGNTRHVHIGGMNNLGAFVHEYGNKKYITKIAKYKGTNKREVLFYKKLCSDFPILQEFVPMYMDSQVMDQILYLTIEMIDGDAAGPEHFGKIMDISEKISSITYQNLIGKFNIPKYQYQFNLRNPNIVTQFFTQIHQEKYNRKLFDSLQILLNQKAYPVEIYQMAHRLESLVMENQLYNFVEPEKHYTLMHGEFKPESMIIEEKSGKPYVIDWSTFTIGPRVVEMARYLSTSLPAYSKVKQLYLNQEQMIDRLAFIERIIFLYAIILFYILRFIKSRSPNTRRKITDFIGLAFDDMEQLVASNRSWFEDKQKVKKLEQRITALEKEKKQLRKRLHHVLHSKSWKMTSPLRKIAKRIRGQ